MLGTAHPHLSTADPVALSRGGANIPGNARLATLRDAEGRLQAALHIYTTYGTNLNMRFVGGCPSAKYLYSRALSGTRSESPECVLIGGPFPAATVIGQMERMKTVAADLTAGLPEIVTVLNLFMSNSNGASVMIEGVFAPSFKGLEGIKPVGEPPANVAASIAAWGDAAAEAAQAAMRSLSGQLVVPPVLLAGGNAAARPASAP